MLSTCRNNMMEGRCERSEDGRRETNKPPSKAKPRRSFQRGVAKWPVTC